MIDYYVQYLKERKQVRNLENKIDLIKRNYEKEIERLKQMIINPITKMNKNKELIEILQKVCDVTGIMPHDIFTPTRKREVVIARQLFCYVTMTHYHFTWVAVGKFLNRDHSTIIHSVKTYSDYIQMKYKQESNFYEETKKALSIGYDEE
jgi:chromosomal replication initiation ATPase DnaA